VGVFTQTGGEHYATTLALGKIDAKGRHLRELRAQKKPVAKTDFHAPTIHFTILMQFVKPGAARK